MQLFHIVNLNISATCGVFLAYVQAVNGAGQSDPSNNVTIPSLPDIEPVTASLTHRVWKSNGHIMVNVSFEQAQYCKEYPVLTYNVILGQQPAGELLMVAVHGNLTVFEVRLGPEHGLRINQRYVVTVVAVTTVGSVASNASKVLTTSDLQAVNVSLVDDLTLDVQCMFIMGSDAMGCRIEIISNQSGVKNGTATLSREQGAMYASGQLNLTHKSHCYDRVLAFNIDKHSTTSNFSIETKLPGTTNIRCSGSGPSALVAGIVGAVVVLVVATVVICVMVGLVRRQVSIKRKIISRNHSPTIAERGNKANLQWRSLEVEKKLEIYESENQKKESEKYEQPEAVGADSCKEQVDSFSFDRTTPTNHSPAAEALPVYTLPNKNKLQKAEGSNIDPEAPAQRH